MHTAKVFDIGKQGDGLIKHDGRTVFVEGALPNEEIKYTLISETRGKLEEVLTPSPDRKTPECPFFERCGGCTLQHLSPALYHEFKVRYFKESLPKHWTDVEFDEAIFIPEKTRRRVSFGVVWNGLARWFGFNEKGSEKILNIDSCLALEPALEKLITPLRQWILGASCAFPKKRGVGDISLLQTQTGIDMLITLPFEADFNWRQTVTDFASQNNIARVSWRYSERHVAEPLAILNTPILSIADFTIKPPAGVFLQPSKQGEEALQNSVLEYVGKAKNVLDLFCGIGTFTLPLLQKKKKLHGADFAPEALEALNIASSNRVEIEERDLFKAPLYFEELNKFDAIIFDPPRAGAKKQCEQMADCDVKRIVAVSCNPASFVKDAQTLIQGGYELKRIRPIDQFIYTPHLELVALFEKSF